MPYFIDIDYYGLAVFGATPHNHRVTVTLAYNIVVVELSIFYYLLIDHSIRFGGVVGDAESVIGGVASFNDAEKMGVGEVINRQCACCIAYELMRECSYSA